MVVRFCRRDIALLTLALCLCATGARAQMLQRGIVIDRVECSDDTAQITRSTCRRAILQSARGACFSHSTRRRAGG